MPKLDILIMAPLTSGAARSYITGIRDKFGLGGDELKRLRKLQFWAVVAVVDGKFLTDTITLESIPTFIRSLTGAKGEARWETAP